MPPLVTQIADGENGGVMMNEFPPKYLEVVRECSGTQTPMMNVTEYLEHLFAAGIQQADLPAIQPLFQKRIWDQMKPGAGPERLAEVIEELRAEDDRFHVEGGSWTNDISWVRGYDSVLVPMEQASSLFHERIRPAGVARPTTRATATRCSTCCCARRAATATGARASGPTTAPNWPAAVTRSSPTTSDPVEPARPPCPMPAPFPGPEPAPSAGNLELRCCIRIRRTKVPKVFPELALAAHSDGLSRS